MNYKTPGAYVEEISKFPPSVAQVETAIPAFVGYTQSGPKNEPTRITSLLEYQTTFGGANQETAFTIAVSTDQTSTTVTKGAVSPFKMYYALQMYFANGGGPCYIVSVGDYSGDVVVGTTQTDGLRKGLETLVKEDEPTLLVFPDLDGFAATDVAAAAATADALAHAAPADVATATTNNDAAQATLTATLAIAHGLYNDALNQAEKMGDRFAILDILGSVEAFRNDVNTTGLKYGAAYHPKLETVLTYNFNDEDITVNGAGTYIPLDTHGVPMPAAPINNLALLKAQKSALYNQAKKGIESFRVVLAPSSTMAGVYAKTDSTVGVWKAPANTGLNYVITPTIKISSQDQESLNVDADGGKSINAIRSFTGKGTLVWGARTLDGNSNEWRYVSVRRFFNMVEESVVKATQGFVFESNNAQTWVRMEAMIGNFLNKQWMDGALAGSTPEDAYYVSIGLNKTMSAVDILEGRMIVEIGMAAVRPAEFIVLRFSHKLQES